jgi:predicted neuraminidase
MMRAVCIAGMVLAVQLTASAQFQVETVYTPADPGGDYKHPATITELHNGDLLIGFYGGAGEYEEDSKCWVGRKQAGNDTWDDPVVVADTPLRSDGNTVVWQAPDTDRVWLFYLTRYGDTWSESRTKFKFSDDAGHTWSDPDTLQCELGTMVQGMPIVLSDGKYLVPVYHETGHDREIVGPDTTSFFLRLDPKTGEFEETSRIRSEQGNLQAAVVELDEEGNLLAYMRRGGGYGPDTHGYIVKSESRDFGRTWTPGEDTDFPNPNAAVSLIKLQSGNLLLVYNDSMADRTPLVAAISTDNGETWPHRSVLMTGYNAFAYPYAIQTKDGDIKLVFTTHRRTHVNVATFHEEDVIEDRIEPVDMPMPAEMIRQN